MTFFDGRRSGVLLHISSLPGNYGVGEIGPEAERFADFLRAAGFSAWQVLPLAPVESVMGNSPYSGASAFAGNFLFISVDKLIDDGLISPEEAECLRVDSKQADYEGAARVKKTLLRGAWDKFNSDRERFGEMRKEFEDFRREESAWLFDYALFRAIKQKFNGASWSEWPDQFRLREPEALEAFASESENRDSIDFTSFVQFVFCRQWKQFRDYCNALGISIIGDVPMFVSFDSADVWSARGAFDLDAAGRPRRVAGVPPDYFSKTGQRWGNPLYNWEAMRSDGFSWWTMRIRGTLKFFDVVRIDHFRGFCGYWAIPSEDETAENGEWENAPGEELMRALQKEFASGERRLLPFIAEDLGIITDDVCSLMSDFEIPGMKVLLFAFSMIGSSYAPHNHKKTDVIYTGTHDNNTARGWWENEASAEEKKIFGLYAGDRGSSASRAMVNMALASPAFLSVIPAQDLLDLGGEARMNVPGTCCGGNWAWRLSPEDFENLLRRTEELRRLNWVCERLRGDL